MAIGIGHAFNVATREETVVLKNPSVLVYKQQLKKLMIEWENQ